MCKFIENLSVERHFWVFFHTVLFILLIDSVYLMFIRIQSLTDFISFEMTNVSCFVFKLFINYLSSFHTHFVFHETICIS